MKYTTALLSSIVLGLFSHSASANDLTCVAPKTITSTLDMMNDGLIEKNNEVLGYTGYFVAKTHNNSEDNDTNTEACNQVAEFSSKTFILPLTGSLGGATKQAKFVAAYGVAANIRSTIRVLWVNSLVYETEDGKRITLHPSKSPMIPMGNVHGQLNRPEGWKPDIAFKGDEATYWQCKAERCAIAYL